jgi:hypothetical protein
VIGAGEIAVKVQAEPFYLALLATGTTGAAGGIAIVVFVTLLWLAVLFEELVVLAGLDELLAAGVTIIKVRDQKILLR